MSTRNDARFAFSVKNFRAYALNDDLSQPTPDNIIGGAGPFDMSGLTAASVAMSIKVDNAAAVDFTVDISAAVSQAAVTVDEVVTAIEASITAGTLPIAVEKDSTSGRVKITSTGTPAVLQVYGDFAEAIRIGQGFGLKYILSNTIKSIGNTPMRKDGETFTSTNGNGQDEEVMTDGQYKGEDGTIVDSAEDLAMKALFEGRKLGTDGSYSSPLSDTARPFLHLEAFYGMYRKGISYEDEAIGYTQDIYYHAKGLSGDVNRDRNIIDSNYTFKNTNYYVDNVEQSGYKKVPLTIAQYKALTVMAV